MICRRMDFQSDHPFNVAGACDSSSNSFIIVTMMMMINFFSCTDNILKDSTTRWYFFFSWLRSGKYNDHTATHANTQILGCGCLCGRWYLGTVSHSRTINGQHQPAKNEESKMKNVKVKTKDDFSNLNFIIIPVRLSRHDCPARLGFLLCVIIVVVNMMNRDNFLLIQPPTHNQTTLVVLTKLPGATQEWPGGKRGSFSLDGLK